MILPEGLVIYTPAVLNSYWCTLLTLEGFLSTEGERTNSKWEEPAVVQGSPVLYLPVIIPASETLVTATVSKIAPDGIFVREVTRSCTGVVTLPTPHPWFSSSSSLVTTTTSLGSSSLGICSTILGWNKDLFLPTSLSMHNLSQVSTCSTYEKRRFTLEDSAVEGIAFERKRLWTWVNSKSPSLSAFAEAEGSSWVGCLHMVL